MSEVLILRNWSRKFEIQTKKTVPREVLSVIENYFLLIVLYLLCEENKKLNHPLSLYHKNDNDKVQRYVRCDAGHYQTTCMGNAY